MTQNRFLVANAKSYRHNELVITGHVIDQYLMRHPRAPESPTAESQKLRDFHRDVGRTIADAVRRSVFYKDHKESKLYYIEGMVYVVRVYEHYKKVITCYPRVVKLEFSAPAFQARGNNGSS
jgi:hypothetical protein